MKKFSSFAERIGDNEEIATTEILIHSMSYLDQAANIAIKKDDSELLMMIYEEALKASDRLTAIALHLEQEEEENESINAESQFGFRAPESVSDPEEDSE